MSRQLTLGSLFDGSGGFPLGAFLTGIEPLWASEVEPFPIRVTTKRLPGLLHLGDINKIDGSAIPPVDIVTGGFCCQDLSVAGKRAGLHGERSGLFFQVVRIIKEMRGATGGEYPKAAVLENVPGMYSSNHGRDFLEVINELIRIKDETLSVPLPQKGKWATAGEIVGDGFSLAWRTFDAQFWGVAQRRRRCYIVIDFTGERAGEILFDETRLCGHPPQGCFTRETTAGDIEACFGSALAFEPGAASRLGAHAWTDVTGTLRADMGDNQLAVVYDARGNGNGETTATITGEYNRCVTDYTALALEPKTLKIRSGCEGGGKGALVQDNLSATLSTGNDQTVFVPTAYGISSYDSNAMKSANPTAGIYEAGTARTLDIGGGNPACNQGGIAIVFDGKKITSKDNRSNPKHGDPFHTLSTGSADAAVVCMEGNASRPSHRGDGIREDVSFTLNSVERHNIAYAMTTGSFMQVCEDKSPTLQARDFKDAPAIARPQYTVRRLTPTECALLQGFPPDYCEDLETHSPTEDDIAFWSDVWEKHRLIVGKSKKPRSRKQIIKWLQNPHSDAAEYKMWGNGVALPCVVFALGGIAYYMS